ncbi:hypothetical protein D3C76_711380 [compost metagenome]
MQAQPWLRWLRQYKRADAVACFYQTRRLQLGDGLPDNGAAHAMLENDGGFRGQLFAWLQLAEQNALGQRLDHALGQVGRTSTDRDAVFSLHRF